MLKKVAAGVLCLAGLACLSVRAEVTPIIIHLTETSPSYTVPATNILVIENGYVGENSSISQYLILSNGATAFGMRIDSWFRKITSLQPSLKIPGGWTLSANSLSTNLDQTVTLCGLLVGPQDVYAGTPATFEGLARAGGGLQAVASIERPLPVRMSVEESPDLETWRLSTNALVSSLTNRTDFSVSVAAGGPASDFYRLDTRLRRGPGGI